MISPNEPTRYEITAEHPDGRKFLICYAAGGPSGRRLRSCIHERGRAIVDTLSLAEDAAFGPTAIKPWGLE